MDERTQYVAQQLTRILSGDLPLSAVREILAEDVILHVSQVTNQGVGVWEDWVWFLRARRRVSNLRVEVARLVENDDGTITAYARWTGIRNGTLTKSELRTATYRLANGKIVEIWSTHKNYAFILGPLANTLPGLALWSVWARFWRWRQRRQSAQILPEHT